MQRVVLVLALALSAPVGVAACEEKTSPSGAARADASAGADKYATADPKLTKALQAVASASAGADKGPPPEGIFAPGAADRRHPKGLPTGVDVVSDGSDPKISLAGTATPEAMRASSYGTAALRLGEQRGRMARPTVDFTFALGPAKKDDGGADWLVAEVKKAVPAPQSQQMGALPAGMDKVVGSLAGTQIRLKVTADGRVSEVHAQLGKAAQPELEVLADSAAESLALVTVPLPDRPVGVGAQWIAETRMPIDGLDVIVYRAFRVKSIAESRVHLSVDVKAYAATKDPDVPGIPKGATFAQYEAEAQGEMEIVRGESLARVSDVQQRVVMLFKAPGSPPPDTPPGPGGPQVGIIPMQIQSQATLARGEDLHAASARP